MTFTLRKYKAPDFEQAILMYAPDVVLQAAPRDGVAPDGYHATSIYPEYYRVCGKWLLAQDSRMDCVAVYHDGRMDAVEFRNLRKGDLVAVGRTEDGSEGILVWPYGFADKGESGDVFAFRTGRSRETSFSRDYDDLYELLRYEKHHGNILWVMGPACTFDHDSRAAFSGLVREGYVHGLLAGNALATHDLEGAYLKTALGQDIYTQENQPLGHYNHLDTLNRVRASGSIEQFIREEKINDGIISSCVEKNVPFVLGGSIRDDGPLPETIGDVYAAQDRMRELTRHATTVICMAKMLHSIAVGNMTPSYRVMEDGSVREIYFYVVDISEFMVRKLADRGSLSARSIVTNAQDFIVQVYKNLRTDS